MATAQGVVEPVPIQDAPTTDREAAEHDGHPAESQQLERTGGPEAAEGAKHWQGDEGDVDPTGAQVAEAPLRDGQLGDQVGGEGAPDR